MDRHRAVEQIAEAAHRAWDRANPDTLDKLALHCLAWAGRNAKSKGDAFAGGHLAGVSTAAARVATLAESVGQTMKLALSGPVNSALFFASECLVTEGDVPDDQIMACVAALDGWNRAHAA